MMTVAKTKTGKIIQASEASVGQNYFCLRCGKVVRVRQTKYGRSFYHWNFTPHSTNPEGKFHQAGKAMLLKWAEQWGANLSQEVVIGSQRADIVWGEDRIFEIQASPLSCQQLQDRHQQYRQQGWKDYWFGGSRFYYANQHYHSMVHYHPQLGCHLWEIHPWQQQIHLYYHLTSVPQTTQHLVLTHPVTRYPSIHLREVEVASLVAKRYRKMRQRAYYHDRSLSQLMAQCYEHHLAFWETLPWFLLPVSLPYPNLICELEWKYHCVFPSWQVQSLQNCFPLIDHHVELLQQSFQYQLRKQGQMGYDFPLSPSFLKFEKSFM